MRFLIDVENILIVTLISIFKYLSLDISTNDEPEEDETQKKNRLNVHL